MKRMLNCSLLAMAISVGAAHAATDALQNAEVASCKMLFASPVALRGTLGDARVQVKLRTKTEMEDGIEGEYFVFGQSQQVLLAGEVEGDDVFLEESENGSDVSGQWNGKLADDIITGEWQSADGKLTRPFKLHIVRADDKAKRTSAPKSIAQNKQQ
jgi:hypothetical protein